MRPEVLLQEPPERVGGGEVAVGGPHRQEPVGVHGLQPHSELLGRRAHHSRQEERWKLVGHHHAGLPRQSLEKAFAFAGLRLQVRVVARRRPLGGEQVVAHPLGQEAVQTIAGPAVVAAQRLENDQRTREPLCPLHGALEGEVLM
jgi:hypothetical protein